MHVAGASDRGDMIPLIQGSEVVACQSLAEEIDISWEV